MQVRSRTELVLLCAAYLVVFCVSLFANSLVCHVVRRHRRLHSVTNVLIANLAVSDIFITVVNVPLNVARHVTPAGGGGGGGGGWPLGHATCALANLALTAFVYVSTLTMTAIAVDRYVVILHPLQPRMSLAVALGVVVATWIIAVLLSLPFAVFAQVSQHSIMHSLSVYTCASPLQVLDNRSSTDRTGGVSAISQNHCVSISCGVVVDLLN